MTGKMINFKVNVDNPDESRILEFLNVCKQFGLGKSALCKLAVKRLISDVLQGELQDSLFSNPHLIESLRENKIITGNVSTPPVINPDLESKTVETAPAETDEVTIPDSLKNMMKGN